MRNDSHGVAILILVTWLISQLAWAFDLHEMTLKQVQRVSESEGMLGDVLVPEKILRRESAKDRVTPPEPERAHAEHWVKSILKEEWIPAGIQSLMVGFKDIEQANIKYPDGSHATADLIVTEYSRRGYHFHIIENGLGLSVRVDLPPGLPVLNQRDSLKASLMQFFNINGIYLDGSSWEIRSRPGLFYGWIKAKTRSRRHGLYMSQWWEEFSFGSDGTFIFIQVSEIDENSSPMASGCCPKRF